LRAERAVLAVRAATLSLAMTCFALSGCEADTHAVRADTRILRDRLHPWNNPAHEDYSFLNGVGAVWPEELGHAAIPYDASSGFLIDRCHVLTNLHVVYADDLVSFGVGQTERETGRGAARGLEFLFHGVVVAHGETTIVDHVVERPEADWALLRLTTQVADRISALPLVTPNLEELKPGTPLAAAGFPTDHRAMRADGLNFKDLWGSAGNLVDVAASGANGAIAETTIQATRGMSGGPIYMSIGGDAHVVIGMVQSIRGNGLDVSAYQPNVEVLFTPQLLAEIGSAVARTPCR
jgi:hypothetical protein